MEDSRIPHRATEWELKGCKEETGTAKEKLNEHHVAKHNLKN